MADQMLWERVDALESLTEYLTQCLEARTNRVLTLDPATASQQDARIGSQRLDMIRQESTAATHDPGLPPDSSAKKVTVH